MKAALRESLARYLSDGIPTGDCLRAILCGDLFVAFARADQETAAQMHEIVAEIETTLPPASYGSCAQVGLWIAKHNARRAHERSREARP